MINKVTLIGNLGKDPELQNVNGTPLLKFSLATNESYKDSAGEWQQKTTWHNVVFWSKYASSYAERLAKGDLVYIEGSIDNRSYEDKEGNKRYISEIKALKIKPMPKATQESAVTYRAANDESPEVYKDSDGKDLPF